MGYTYVTTVPGLMKVVEEVFNFIAFMCIACHDYTTARGDAFLAASVGAFIITAIFLVVYVLDLQDRIPVPWVQIQFFYCLIWAVFYLITSALVIDAGVHVNDSYIAGGVFGLFATLIYAVDAFFKYREQE